jgi:hypothetical protein
VRALLAALVAAFVLTALTALAPAPAFACSCAALTTPDSVAGADAVFLGTATADGVRVEEVFKGMLPSQLPLDGSPDPCPAGLVNGERYVVFATWHDDQQRYATDPCSGTAAATAVLVDEVERVAGSGRPPYDVPGGLPDDTAPQGLAAVDGWVWLMLATGAAATVLVAIGGLLVVRANRASG